MSTYDPTMPGGFRSSYGIQPNASPAQRPSFRTVEQEDAPMRYAAGARMGPFPRLGAGATAGRPGMLMVEEDPGVQFGRLLYAVLQRWGGAQ